MRYRCVATSPEGLVQQVAVSYLRHGYWWYVSGRIPGTKPPELIDQKLLDKYGIGLTERQRAYRKSRGLANLQYERRSRERTVLSSSRVRDTKGAKQSGLGRTERKRSPEQPGPQGNARMQNHGRNIPRRTYFRRRYFSSAAGLSRNCLENR